MTHFVTNTHFSEKRTDNATVVLMGATPFMVWSTLRFDETITRHGHDLECEMSTHLFRNENWIDRERLDFQVLLTLLGILIEIIIE